MYPGVLVLQIVGWLSGLWLLARTPGCRPPSGFVGSGRLSLIIPARNEACSLPQLLDSLRVQSSPPAEVVVVDDGSSDDTAALALAGGARVVPTAPLPADWIGKSWACWTGAQATSGDLLIFLDADTYLAPDGLARLVAEQAMAGGLLSVQPYHRCGRPVESLSALFNVVAMMGVDAFSPRGGRRPAAGAFGPCLVCTRLDYEAVGGHQAVRAAILDDVELARLFRDRGFDVRCLAGRSTVGFRMYPQGVGQLIEGWTKNFAKGAAAVRPATTIGVFGWITALLSCAGGLTAAVGAFSAGHPDGGRLAAFGVAYVVHAATLAWMLARIGRFRWWAWALWPVCLVVFVAVFARSALRTVARRPVRWKGRWVATAAPVNPGRPPRR